MSTENTFYRVRRPGEHALPGMPEHQWLTQSLNWSPSVQHAWSFQMRGDAEVRARQHARQGARVVTVRHKVIPAKPRTHDRAWALRQLAKGRSVTNAVWASDVFAHERHDGIRFMVGDVMGTGCYLVPDNGYTLWQEPAK